LPLTQCNANIEIFKDLCSGRKAVQSALRDLHALLGFVEDSGGHCLPVELSGYKQKRLNNNRTVNDWPEYDYQCGPQLGRYVR
jgi:hypothetical protein